MVSKTVLLEGPGIPSAQAPYPRIILLKYHLGYWPQHQNSPARLVSLDSRLRAMDLQYHLTFQFSLSPSE